MVVFLVMAATAWGQSQPAFEVASIKPVAVGSRPSQAGVRIDGAVADFPNASLASLISRAYRVRSFQVSGPDWMGTARFDVVAKLPQGASPDLAPEMLQTLLAERFKLILHRETKEFPAYALIVGNGGPKLTPRPADYSSVAESIAKPITLEALSWALALDRPIIDVTGLKGEYMVSMDEYGKLTDSAIKQVKALDRAGVANYTELMTDALASAAKRFVEDLGLKLEARKLALLLLVIDHLDKVPTEN
jgi:uncharacterized protein (TIGR03435 family)